MVGHPDKNPRLAIDAEIASCKTDFFEHLTQCILGVGIIAGNEQKSLRLAG